MNAMKPSSKQERSRKQLDEVKEEQEAEPVMPKKSITGKSLGKKKATSKKPEDTMTRFFNSYGDSPHLQAIEDSYLQYLQQ